MLGRWLLLKWMWPVYKNVAFVRFHRKVYLLDYTGQDTMFQNLVSWIVVGRLFLIEFWRAEPYGLTQSSNILVVLVISILEYTFHINYWGQLK